MKVRVVCREGRNDSVVRYAWYFDERGRRLKEEDIVAGKPELSRIIEFDYDRHATEVVATRVYDGNGKLLESTGAEDPGRLAPGEEPVRRGKSTYTEYLTACQASPNTVLHPLMGNEKEPQFFVKAACACLAEKAVRADQAPASPVWARSKTLDATNVKDRLAVVAMQNLGDCLCPEAFPESRLSELCSHASEIEKAWKP